MASTKASPASSLGSLTGFHQAGPMGVQGVPHRYMLRRNFRCRASSLNGFRGLGLQEEGCSGCSVELWGSSPSGLQKAYSEGYVPPNPKLRRSWGDLPLMVSRNLPTGDSAESPKACAKVWGLSGCAYVASQTFQIS